MAQTPTGLTPEQHALLETIAGPESAGNYDIMYGGKRFDDFSDHPRVAVPITRGPNAGKTSSAAGKYQFIGSTWDAYSNGSDFSPANQDQAAWRLASTEYRNDTGRDLQSDLAAGDLSRVPGSLRNQWTSMPGGIEQGITGDNFQSAYQRNMGMTLSGRPDAALGYASAGAPVSAGLLGGPINLATNKPASQFTSTGAKLPPMVPSGVKANNVGAMPSWAGMRDIQGRNVTGLPGLDNIVNNVRDAPMNIVNNVKGLGTNVSNFMKDPGAWVTKARADTAAKVNTTMKDTFVNPRNYQGITLSSTPFAGAAPVNLAATGAPAFVSGNPASNAFDAKFHGGQNMDVYRANVASSGSGAPKVVAQGMSQIDKDRYRSGGSKASNGDNSSLSLGY